MKACIESIMPELINLKEKYSRVASLHASKVTIGNIVDRSRQWVDAGFKCDAPRLSGMPVIEDDYLAVGWIVGLDQFGDILFTIKPDE